MNAVLLLLLLIPSFIHPRERQEPERDASRAEKRRQLEDENSERGKKAIANARQRVSDNPDSAEAHLDLAQKLIYGPTTAEEHDKILEEYLSAIRLKPDYAEAYFRLGMYYANQDKYKKGYEALNKAISLKPAYAEAYCGLGFVYIQKKFGDGHRLPLTEEETAMAVKVFKKAIEIRPDLLEAYVGLGQASLYRRQYNDALEAFQDAAAIDPNEIMSHVGMAAAFIELGDKDAALQEHVVLKRLASEYQAKMIEKGLDSFPNPAEPYADRLLKEIRERFPDK